MRRNTYALVAAAMAIGLIASACSSSPNSTSKTTSPADSTVPVHFSSIPAHPNCAFLLNLGRRGPAVQQFQSSVSCEADDDIERLNQLHSSGGSRQSSRNSFGS